MSSRSEKSTVEPSGGECPADLVSGGVNDRAARLWFLLLALAGYVAAAWWLGWLGGAPSRDEVHFWPTSLRFAAEPIPSLELLRGYGELSTPFPFMVFGWLEAGFGGGIAVGRLFNALVSFATLSVFVLLARGRPGRVVAAACCAFSFPYLIGSSFFLYTDMIAASAAFFGLVAFRRSRWITAAVFFAVGVSSRQYMVAVPAAIGLHALVEHLRIHGVGAGLRRFAGYPGGWVCASGGAVLLAWVVFFGGFAPIGEVLRQDIQTRSTVALIPRNAVYFLAVIGAYYVPLWCVWEWWDRRSMGSWGGIRVRVRGVVLLAILGGLVLAFPPIGNTDYPIETMGFLDKALRLVLGDRDGVRVAVLGVLAGAAVLRFRSWSFGTALVLVHAVMLMKAHIAWDKYALVCLLCLWFVEADSEPVAVGASPVGEQDPPLGGAEGERGDLPA